MKQQQSIDNIYLNIPITPNESVPYELRTANFNQVLSQAILQNPEDYYLAICRWNLPTETIPLFQFPVDVTQNNPLISTFYMGLNVSGTYFKAPVQLINLNATSAPIPLASAPYFTQQQVNGGYYQVFYIQHFVNMLNATLRFLANDAGIDVSNPPTLVYSPVTQLLTLNLSQIFVTTGARIFTNTKLLPYMDGFMMSYDYSESALAQNLGTLYYIVTTPLPYGQTGPYAIVQDRVAIYSWSNLSKIIVKTNSLPVFQEASPNQNISGLAGAQVGFSSILSDYVIAYDDVNQFRSELVYQPAFYRLVDLVGTTNPITRINLKFLYVTTYGQEHNIILNLGTSIDVKLGFFKKSLYNNDFRIRTEEQEATQYIAQPIGIPQAGLNQQALRGGRQRLR